MIAPTCDDGFPCAQLLSDCPNCCYKCEWLLLLCRENTPHLLSPHLAEFYKPLPPPASCFQNPNAFKPFLTGKGRQLLNHLACTFWGDISSVSLYIHISSVYPSLYIHFSEYIFLQMGWPILHFKCERSTMTRPQLQISCQVIQCQWHYSDPSNMYMI